MAQIFKNNTMGTLASELAAGATTCTLNVGHTFTDPGSDWYLATLVGVTGTTETSWEIVKVTNVATNTLTIERAQESTSDATWPAGTRIEARLTAWATESKANLGAAAYKAVGTGSGDVAAGNRGVTNGDSHDHNGGDGGQIAYSSLSGLPTLGTAAAAATTDFAAASHNQAETTITFTDISTGNASTTAHGFAPKATAPASGLRSVLAIDNGETVRSDKALFDATNPAALGTASPGTAMTAARRDHVHALPNLGKILQVVLGSTTTTVSLETTVYTSIGLSVSITPNATSSKILLIAVVPVWVHGNTTEEYSADTRLKRDSTQIAEKKVVPYTLSEITTDVNFLVLDAPSTTSAITYSLEGKCHNGNTLVDYFDGSAYGSIVALEVAA